MTPSAPPRYSTRPLPAYAYVPGHGPHPRRDPRGHAFGRPEPEVQRVAPEAWSTAEDYLHAIDLLNAGYAWECHEALEGLWRGAGRGTRQGSFLQALILLAAARLQRAAGHARASRSQAQRALERLEPFVGTYMGVDTPRLARELRTELDTRGAERARIRLAQSN